MARSRRRVRAAAAGGTHGFPWPAAGTAVVALLALFGAGMIGAAVTTGPSSPPQPAYQAQPAQTETAGADPDLRRGRPPADSRASGDLPADPLVRPGGLARSEPTTVRVPRVGIDARIMPLGVNPDKTVEVPPLSQAMLAGWYRLGPSPGETGNAVIIGHVDSAQLGPAVFFRLGELLPGDTVEVTRRDGRTARFVIDRVGSYPKTDFPTDLVYGPADSAQLRLVTCGGVFDRQTGSYLNNIVVFASLAT